MPLCYLLSLGLLSPLGLLLPPFHRLPLCYLLPLGLLLYLGLLLPL